MNPIIVFPTGECLAGLGKPFDIHLVFLFTLDTGIWRRCHYTSARGRGGARLPRERRRLECLGARRHRVRGDIVGYRAHGILAGAG